MSWQRSAAVIAGAFLALAGTSSGVTADPLDVFLEDLVSYRARFEQRVVDAEGRVLDEVRGELVWARPARFRWDYRVPYEQLIVSDGERIWIYDPDLEQVTIEPAGPGLGGSPLALLEGRATLEETFEVTEEPAPDGDFWIRLAPRDPEDDFESICMRLDAGELAVIEIHDRFGQVTTIELADVERNVAVDDRQFEFRAPDGVDVIDNTP